MGRRGRKRQLNVETRYWRLLASGVGTVEACRRWGSPERRDSDGEPSVVASAVRLDEDARSNRYLSFLGRQRIVTLRARGLGVREIARRLVRAILASINDYRFAIASAVEEQTATTNEMSRSVTEAATRSSEIASSISGVASGAASSSEVLVQMGSSVNELALLSADLRGRLGAFTY